MEWKIKWESGCFDEIESIYEKAGDNEKIADLLSKMEGKALQEAEDHCELIKENGQTLTRERFVAMPGAQKEQVIYMLSQMGLEKFDISMANPVITVTLSHRIQMVLGCTMFSIMNRLEKLDGSYNVVQHAKAVLEFHVPLEAREGLFECECLIMLLFPWLSVSEKSRNILASTASYGDPEETESSVRTAGKVYSPEVLKALREVVEGEKNESTRTEQENSKNTYNNGCMEFLLPKGLVIRVVVLIIFILIIFALTRGI